MLVTQEMVITETGNAGQMRDGDMCNEKCWSDERLISVVGNTDQSTLCGQYKHLH